MTGAAVQNRKDIREAFATLLASAIEGSGKPAQKVYNYRVSDFRGRHSVALVTSGTSNRAKQAQVTRTSSRVKLDIHTFVLYSGKRVNASNNPAAGSNVQILLDDTSDYEVGDVVTVEDDDHVETATVTAVVADTSITVNTLTQSYTNPTINWWTEHQAEDRMDLFEKMISDVIMDNDTNDDWAQVSFDGDTTDDPVAIGGKEYLHEIIHLVFQLHSG